MAGSKNQDIIELVIKGEDEYSDVSEDVRQELEKLSAEAAETRAEFDKLEQSLDLSETYREQEADIDRLATAQAKSKQAVDALTKANKEAKGTNTDIAASLAKTKAEYTSLRAATNKAQKAFDQTKDSMRKYGVEVEKVESNQDEMRRSADRLSSEIEQLAQSQDDLVHSARDQVRIAKEQVAAEKALGEATEKYRVELSRLVEEYRQGEISTEKFEQAESDLRAKLRLSEQQVKETRHAMGAYADQIERVPASQRAAVKSSNSLATVTRGLAKAYAALLVAQQAAAVVTGSVSAYTETENAMLGLQKTTNLTATELEGLTAEMNRLSQDVTPTTKAGLLEIAAAAGRMGVDGADNIKKFTTSIDALSYAAELAGGETAQAVAQILNVTGEAQSNVTGVAAAIAALGNSTATTEGKILSFANRLAADTASIHLTSAEVLGLSASLSEMGLQAEGASTVIGRSFRYIEGAIKDGGKPLEDLQRITGKTSEALIEAFGQDKVALFSEFAQGLGRLQDGGQTLNAILEEMGIKSDENSRILGLLSQRFEGLDRAVKIANESFDAGNAHFAEMAKQAASLSSGFTRLENRITQLQSVMGEAFSDDIARTLDSMGGSAEELDQKFADVAETLADVIDITAGLFGAFSGLTDIFYQATGGIGLLDLAMAAIGATVDSLSNRINIIVAGIAKLAEVSNDFFGDTDDAERWGKIYEDAMERVGEASERNSRRLQGLLGESSRAFDDLKDAYDDNKDALEKMDEEQRKAAQAIIETTGYIEGNDKAYRTLTRAIQRAAEEKQIFAEYTKEENIQIQASIDLLVAQGQTQEEASKKALANAQAQKDAADTEAKAKRDAADAEKTYAEEQQKAADEQAKTSAKISDALKTLKLDLDATSKGLTKVGSDSIDAFKTVYENLDGLGTTAEESAAILQASFESALNSVSTNEGLAELKQQLMAAQASGADFGTSYAKYLDQINEKQKALKDSAKDLGDEIEKTNGKILLVGDLADDAGNKLENSMQGARSAAEGIAGFYNGITASLADLGAKALNAFREIQGAAKLPSGDLESMKDKVSQLGGQLRDLSASGSFGFTGISSWMKKVGRDSALVEKEFYEQKIAVDELVLAYERGDYSSSVFSRSVEDLSRQFNLLDDQDLDQLRSSIQRVQSEVASLNDSLTDTVASLRQELAGLRGDDAEVERLRYQEERLELEAQLQKAQQLGDGKTIAAANEALSLQKEAYSLRVKQAQQQTEAERQQAAQDAAEEERQQQQDEADQREASDAAYAREDRQSQSATATQASTRTIILQSNNARAEVSVDVSQEDDFLTVLEDLGYRSTGA